MTYQSTVEQLYALGHELASTPSHKFDLAYVRVMLEALGHPERRFASVLIAGTNGKGSTAATLTSILRIGGYKTALYSSPHLVSINERLRVNGEAISDVEFGAMHDRVERTAQELLHAGALRNDVVLSSLCTSDKSVDDSDALVYLGDSSLKLSGFLFKSRQKRSTKYFASIGMSSSRSRSGGIVIGNTDRRKYRSSRY